MGSVLTLSLLSFANFFITINWTNLILVSPVFFKKLIHCQIDIFEGGSTDQQKKLGGRAPSEPQAKLIEKLE